MLTNADLERMVDTSDEWIVTRTGIRERRVAAANETTASMAAVAGLRAIHTAGLGPDDIDLIIVATLTPDYWMPSTAALVKEAIGNTKARRVRRHGRLLRLRVRVRHGQRLHRRRDGEARAGHRRGAADPVPRLLGPGHLHPVRRRGRGRGAVGLATSRGTPVGIELTTEPQGAYMIWLPAGGSKSPPSAETVARGEHQIRMEGTETYRFATRTLASTALAAVGKAGWTQDDVDLIVPHQANIRIIEAVAKGLDMPMDRMFVNLDRYGNTSAASVPIALAEAVNEGRLQVGDKLVFVAFGAGLHVRAPWPWSGPRTRPGAGPPTRPSAAEDVTVRLPVDWDSVDPIPPALAEVLARPLPGHMDLSDVVPGEPEHAHHANHATGPLNPPGPRRDTPRGGRTT